MKKHVIATVVAVIMGSTIAFSQAAGPRGAQPGQNAQGAKGVKGARMGNGQAMQKIMAQLNLNEKQKVQLKALSDKRVAEFKAMREKGKNTQPTDRETMKAQFKKQNDAYQAELKKILTPTQYEKFQKLMKEEMAKMAKNRPGGLSGPPGSEKKIGRGGH